jgi:hypothetical protein
MFVTCGRWQIFWQSGASGARRAGLWEEARRLSFSQATVTNRYLSFVVGPFFYTLRCVDGDTKADVSHLLIIMRNQESNSESFILLVCIV